MPAGCVCAPAAQFAGPAQAWAVSCCHACVVEGSTSSCGVLNLEPHRAQLRMAQPLQGFVCANLITRLEPELFTTFLFMVHLL